MVGVIRESAHALIRFRVSAAPPAPAAPNLQGNVFDGLDAKARYDRDLRDYQAAAVAWEGRVNERWARFSGDVEALLADTRLARRSAVWEALARADAALAEPEAGVSSVSSRYILLASDAEDTTASRPKPLVSGATVIVANGAATLGSLAPLEGVERFEGLAAALDWIVRRERAKTAPVSELAASRVH